MRGLINTFLKVQGWLPQWTLSKEYSEKPGALVKELFNFGIIIVVIVSVGVLIYAGFKYVTSQGDTSKTQEASKTIMYALVGLIVALAASLIVNIVWKKLTGQDQLLEIPT